MAPLQCHLAPGGALRCPGRGDLGDQLSSSPFPPAPTPSGLQGPALPPPPQCSGQVRCHMSTQYTLCTTTLDTLRRHQAQAARVPGAQNPNASPRGQGSGRKTADTTGRQRPAWECPTHVVAIPYGTVQKTGQKTRDNVRCRQAWTSTVSSAPRVAWGGDTDLVHKTLLDKVSMMSVH